MKSFFTLLACMAFVLACALPSLFAVDTPGAPIKLEYFPNKIVMFPHDKHAALDCKKCHHKWNEKDIIKPCGDSGCHDVFDKSDKSEKSFYNIVHGKGSADMQSCLACHRQEAGSDKDKKKAMTGCKGSGCHP